MRVTEPVRFRKGKRASCLTSSLRRGDDGSIIYYYTLTVDAGDR